MIPCTRVRSKTLCVSSVFGAEKRNWLRWAVVLFPASNLFLFSDDQACCNLIQCSSCLFVLFVHGFVMACSQFERFFCLPFGASPE